MGNGLVLFGIKMNREIKFRAWYINPSTKEGKMVYSGLENFTGRFSGSIGEGGCVIEMGEHRYVVDADGIQQFTELKLTKQI